MRQRLPRPSRFVVENIMLRSNKLLVAGALLLAATVAGDAFACNRDVVRSTNGNVVRSTNGNCVRTMWENKTDECPGAPAPRPVISREARTVYFPFNSAALTPDAMRRLDTLAQNMKANTQVRGALIVGFADRIGNAAYNEKLSKKRADAVRNYLVSKGIINAQRANTRWFGDSEPATQCPKGMKRPALIQCLQNDRRVEVEIDYAPVEAPAPQKN